MCSDGAKGSPGTSLKESAVEELAIVKRGVVGLFSMALIFGVPAGIIWMLLPDSFTEPTKYATIYSVDKSHVFIERKPTDCDWGHAPIGTKDCHYDKSVETVKAVNGRVSDVYVGWNKVQE
jgi:hypothetical protein